METTLIDQGVNLMLFGMGTVFVFLTILVFATTLMSKVVNTFTPNQTPEEETSGTNSSVLSNPAQPSPQILAAIEKAIAAHRQR